jgi:hypothetical protein
MTLSTSIADGALDDALVAQLDEDRLEELVRDGLCFGDRAGLHRAVAGVPGQMEQRLERVLRAMGQHVAR